MKKLALKLEDLAVASFPTSATPPERGTVLGNGHTQGNTCAGSCGNTICQATCDVSCVPSCISTCDFLPCASGDTTCGV